MFGVVEAEAKVLHARLKMPEQFWDRSTSPPRLTSLLGWGCVQEENEKIIKNALDGIAACVRADTLREVHDKIIEWKGENGDGDWEPADILAL